MTAWRNTDGEPVDVDSDGLFYPFVHLHPETDPIARAICDRLGIDWRPLRGSAPLSPPRGTPNELPTAPNLGHPERG